MVKHNYTFTMVSPLLAICPLFLPDGAQVVGLDGAALHFTLGQGEQRMDLPFGDKTRCFVHQCRVTTPAGVEHLYLMVPSNDGDHLVSVEIQNDRGLWLAVGTLQKGAG